MRLTAMLDGKSKQHDVTRPDGGLHHRRAAGDDLFAFEPAAQEQISLSVACDRVQTGRG